MNLDTLMLMIVMPLTIIGAAAWVYAGAKEAGE